VVGLGVQWPEEKALMPIVLIAPQVYTNPQTGQTSQSSVYHLPVIGLACLANAVRIEEVEEDTALLFGRHLCGTCRDRKQRIDLEDTLFEKVPREEIAALLERLGDPGFEIRVMWHPPGTNSSGKPKSPKIIWTSRDEES
jgi:hypothetical protein